VREQLLDARRGRRLAFDGIRLHAGEDLLYPFRKRLSNIRVPAHHDSMLLEQPLHTLALAAVVGALASAPRQNDGPLAAADALARIGDPVADHEFSRLDWHDGRTRLAQLRGHPVLIGGWKQWLDEPYGLNVVDAADALLGDFAGDGLIVVLEDRNAWSERRWWGARSFFIRFKQHPVWLAAGDPEATKDLPIVRASSARDERSAVLIGVDGTLVFEGTLTDSGDGEAGARLRAAVKQEVARRKEGWGDDKNLAKARALAFGAGKHAAALEAAARSKAAPELVEAVRAEVAAAVAAELVAVEYLLDNGRGPEAESRWDALRKGCRGSDELLAPVDAFEPRFAGSEGQEIRSLGRRLEKILAPMTHDGWRKFDVDHLFELRELAAEHADHPAGRRAARLDPLVKDLAGIACGSHKTIDDAIARRAEKEK
jgi:hypothetical protein